MISTASPPSGVNPPGSKHPGTRRGWYIASGERAAVATAAGTYFLLLCGYYMLRSLREAMALEAGRENIPLLFTLTFATMLAILPIYWWLVARVRRDRLFAVIYLPALVPFISIAALAGDTHVAPVLAGIYFLLVTALNLFIISMFWSVMADLWRPGEAQRLFGIVSAGGSAGALIGPAFNAAFV